jgi:hypothetical protein
VHEPAPDEPDLPPELDDPEPELDPEPDLPPELDDPELDDPELDDPELDDPELELDDKGPELDEPDDEGPDPELDAGPELVPDPEIDPDPLPAGAPEPEFEPELGDDPELDPEPELVPESLADPCDGSELHAAVTDAATATARSGAASFMVVPICPVTGIGASGRRAPRAREKQSCRQILRQWNEAGCAPSVRRDARLGSRRCEAVENGSNGLWGATCLPPPNDVMPGLTRRYTPPARILRGVDIEKRLHDAFEFDVPFRLDQVFVLFATHAVKRRSAPWTWPRKSPYFAVGAAGGRAAGGG